MNAMRVVMRSKGGMQCIVFAAGIAALSCVCAPASAQTPHNPFGDANNNENAKQPINIEADRLTVDDKRQVAIFKGNVSVVQGEHNLRSNELEVVYERPAGSTKDSPQSQARSVAQPAQPAAAAAGDAMTNQQIKTITAIGKVVVTSTKDGQTGTGDKGFFDVKAQKVTLSVDPKADHYVVLTQKGNIVKGKKLVFDLTTGVTIVDPPDDAKKGANGPKHRVTTVLIPGTKPGGDKSNPASALGSILQKKPEASATSSAKKPAADTPQSSGWQTQSR